MNYVVFYVWKCACEWFEYLEKNEFMMATQLTVLNTNDEWHSITFRVEMNKINLT